jgi:hypothetical protein
MICSDRNLFSCVFKPEGDWLCLNNPCVLMGRNFTYYGALFFAVGNKNVSSFMSEAWGELMGCTCLYAYLMISLVHHLLDCSAYWNIKAHGHVQMWKSKCAWRKLSLVVSCWIFWKIKGVCYKSNLPIPRIHAFGIWISDICFNFLTLASIPRGI